MAELQRDWESEELSEKGARLSALWRRAAEHGPGFGGVRGLALDSAREVAAEFRSLGLAVPAHLESPTEWVERRAKLFEAGDYPDKGVSISREHLARLAAEFDGPVPVLVEHAESALELGYLTAVECLGDELFGTVALTREANDLAERSGARALSLGFSPDLLKIREVSLVRNPRVASARLFHSGAEWFGELTEMPDTWQTRFLDLEGRVRLTEAERQVQDWVSSGRVAPAQAGFAMALLAATDSVVFDGSSSPVGVLFRQFVDSGPGFGLFGESAPVGSGVEDHSALLMLPEEVEFYRRHFPDVRLEEIAQGRSGSRRAG